jgi:hypothetical protein
MGGTLWELSKLMICIKNLITVEIDHLGNS